MGDRGGTATISHTPCGSADYTRWEIGGEPQPLEAAGTDGANYTRWEIGGEPQRNDSHRIRALHYTRWEIGGEPQRCRRG